MRWVRDARARAGAAGTWAFVAGATAWGGEARAQAADVSLSAVPSGLAADPSYGRVDGDLTLVVGLGAAAAARGVRAEGELRARYLETAGVFATYEDGATFGSGAEPQRVVSTGLELRPLFLYRWLQGHETRRARLDLTIDSIGLELGAAFWQQAGGGFASQAGVQAGLGVEMPLFEQAAGPWLALHGGLRWGSQVFAYGTVRDADDRSAFVTLTLAWHALVVAHWVDIGDRAPQ